jgi:hypothetical protein
MKTRRNKNKKRTLKGGASAGTSAGATGRSFFDYSPFRSRTVPNPTSEAEDKVAIKKLVKDSAIMLGYETLLTEPSDPFPEKVNKLLENEKIFSQTVTFRKTIEELKKSDIIKKIKNVPANTFQNCDNAIQTLINYTADKGELYEELKGIITLISKKNIVTYRDLNIILEYILNDISPIDISEKNKTILKIIFGTFDGSKYAQIGDYDYIFNVIKQFFIKNNKTNFDRIDLLLASGIIKYDYTNKSIIKYDKISTKLDELITERYITPENKDELIELLEKFDPTKIDELLNQ